MFLLLFNVHFLILLYADEPFEFEATEIEDELTINDGETSIEISNAAVKTEPADEPEKPAGKPRPPRPTPPVLRLSINKGLAMDPAERSAERARELAGGKVIVLQSKSGGTSLGLGGENSLCFCHS